MSERKIMFQILYEQKFSDFVINISRRETTPRQPSHVVFQKKSLSNLHRKFKKISNRTSVRLIFSTLLKVEMSYEYKST